jgi:anti-sigma regulatory factor (Ser/Thr protein kinase)
MHQTTGGDPRYIDDRSAAMTEGPPQIRLSLPAIRDSLPLIRQVIATLVGAQSLPPRRQEQVLIAVATAAADAVRHAYRDAPPPRELVIEGRVRAGKLIITVIEDGPGITPELGTGDVPSGLAVIAAFADRLELGPGAAGGSSTRMSFCLVGSPPG